MSVGILHYWVSIYQAAKEYKTTYPRTQIRWLENCVLPHSIPAKLLGIHKTEDTLYCLALSKCNLHAPVIRQPANRLYYLTLCSSTINLLSCTINDCPEGMVFGNGGSFILGEDPPFFMATYRSVISSRPILHWSVWFPNQEGEYPKNNVTFDEAKHFAQLGNTYAVAQWEYACQGAETGCITMAPICENNVTRRAPRRPSLFSLRTMPKVSKSSRCFWPRNLSEWVDSTWSQINTTESTGETTRGGTIGWKHGQDCTSRHGHHQKDCATQMMDFVAVPNPIKLALNEPKSTGHYRLCQRAARMHNSTTMQSMMNAVSERYVWLIEQIVIWYPINTSNVHGV